MESYQFKMQKALKQYPDIAKSFDDVIGSFAEDNPKRRADAMYHCLERMIEYLYSNCNSDKCDILFDKIEMLYKSKVLTEKSYENYLHIMDYKHKYEYSTKEEEDRILKTLIEELTEFVAVYSASVNKNISLGRQRIHDFFFYRLAGFMALLIGIFGIYNEIKSELMTLYIIGFIILAVIGLLLLIGGKKTAKLWLKIRFHKTD